MVTSADCTRLLPPGSEATLICGVGCYVFATMPGCLCAACLPDSAGSRLHICYRTTVAKKWAAATAEIAAAKIARIASAVFSTTGWCSTMTFAGRYDDLIGKPCIASLADHRDSKTWCCCECILP